MKAIVVREYGDPEVMKLEDAPDLKPDIGQVKVKIKAVGVNPVEVYMRSGSFYKLPLPFTPGSDAAGVVDSVSEGVTKVKAGDRVYTAGTLTGAYAEEALCKESQVHILPENVSFAQGACLGVPYATAYRGLFQRARAVPSETVLIHGATGGVGIAAVQWARSAGMKVIGTGGSEKGRDLTLREGAHHVIDHRAKDHADRIMKLTDGRGVDVIIEFLSDVNLGTDLKLLAPGGRVVVIGCRGTVEIDPRDAMSRDASISGMSLFNASASELASIHAAIRAGLDNRTLRPVVGEEMRLANAKQAHHLIMEKSAFGKIVLIP
jgi:NADPH:quinone reductase